MVCKLNPWRPLISGKLFCFNLPPPTPAQLFDHNSPAYKVSADSLAIVKPFLHNAHGEYFDWDERSSHFINDECFGEY